jgi:hypothetical protein
MILLNQEINKKIQNKFIDDKIFEYNRIIPKDRFLSVKSTERPYIYVP